MWMALVAVMTVDSLRSNTAIRVCRTLLHREIAMAVAAGSPFRHRPRDAGTVTGSCRHSGKCTAPSTRHTVEWIE